MLIRANCPSVRPSHAYTPCPCKSLPLFISLNVLLHHQGGTSANILLCSQSLSTKLKISAVGIGTQSSSKFHTCRVTSTDEMYEGRKHQQYYSLRVDTRLLAHGSDNVVALGAVAALSLWSPQKRSKSQKEGNFHQGRVNGQSMDSCFDQFTVALNVVHSQSAYERAMYTNRTKMSTQDIMW